MWHSNLEQEVCAGMSKPHSGELLLLVSLPNTALIDTHPVSRTSSFCMQIRRYVHSAFRPQEMSAYAAVSYGGEAVQEGRWGENSKC